MLSPHDWEIWREQSVSSVYRRGDTLLEEGSRRRAIFVVRKGAVQVEHVHLGQRIALAQLGPGEVFGEMGFVENAPASASVVALDDVVVEVIEEAALQSLMVSSPGFAVRFYHSLAFALARRLRATSRRLSGAGVGAAAQATRFHQTRTGNISPRQIPSEMSAGLDAFERAMLSLDQELAVGSLQAGEAQRRLGDACDEVVDLLGRTTASQPVIEMGWDDLLAFRDPDRLEAGVGDHVFRATFPFMMLSWTMARCYAKPRGFPDDHDTVAAIYRNEAEGDGRLGPLVDRWFLDRPLCRARRSGRTRMRALLEDLVGTWPAGGPVRVTALASGAAAELVDFYTTGNAAHVFATCVDLDAEALLVTARRAEGSGLGDRMAFLEGDAVPVDGEGVSVRPQHVVYALGLWEYLSDDQAVALLDWSFQHLIDGGAVVVTNLDPANQDRLLMEHLLDWRVNHRTGDDVRALFARSRFAPETPQLSVEPSGDQVVAYCTKGGRRGA